MPLTALRRLKQWIRPRTRWRQFQKHVAVLGTTGALVGWARGWWPRRDVSKLLPLRTPLAEFELSARPGASDVEVFHQVFVEREYSALDDLADVKLVIDCGANVGYSSAYFLSRFPKCRLIAVEPEPGNCAILRKNLAPYGDRVQVIQAGIWPKPAHLAIAWGYRDGRDWAVQVRECGPGEKSDLIGIDVASLIDESGFDRVSLLKMDIEGAEALLFAEGQTDWLDRVDALAIELHDDSAFGPATELFERAMAGRPFAIATQGEVTFCRRTT
jgi:FkbM family methyltransferase